MRWKLPEKGHYMKEMVNRGLPSQRSTFWSTFPERDILRQSRDCHSAAEFEEAIKSMKVIYGSPQLFMAPGQLQEEPPSADGQREQRPCR